MKALVCPACSKHVKVKDELAGKRVKCPGCGKGISVPTNGPTAFEANRPPVQPFAEERTLPPRPPVVSKGATVSAAGARQADERSNATPDFGNDNDAEDNARAHYDFLAPAERPDEIGRLGGFRILKVLGAGGMGVVFQAEDPKLERKLAIKAMLPSLAASESARKRFLREAKTAAAIEHDHIVPILQVGEDHGVPFIAMPFLKGEPLDDRLKRDGALLVAEVVKIGREAAKGLAAAHAVGLIHRDIKPANLWLETLPGEQEADGVVPYRVKILDFGLARAAADNAQLTQQGAIIGTPAYMAPEQAAGKGLDARCDLFSLGCVLYRLATGQAPFKGTDTISTLISVASDEPPAPHKVNSALPEELSELVMDLLAKKPEDRPESARVVAERLAALAVDSTANTTKSGRATGSPQGGKTRVRSVSARRRRQRLAIGVAVLLAVLIVGVALLFSMRTRTGTLVVNLSEPDVQVLIDGESKSAGSTSGVVRLELPPGEHKLIVKRVAEELYSAPFTIERGAEVVMDAKWTPRQYTNSLGMEFVLVPKGKSWLGGEGGQPGTKEVEIKEDFYLGKYEVTQEEWEKVVGSIPSYFSRMGAGKELVKDIADTELKRFPVELVSWEDAQLFLKEVNQRDPQVGWVYRLPREVEWEYACRGGPMTDKGDSAFDFYFDKPVGQLQPEQANFEGKGLKRTCKVGSYQPNRLGLYDMHGNVWEWCDDEQKVDKGASLRVHRGGCWHNDSGLCRAALRYANAPSIRQHLLGLRLARVPVGGTGK